MPSPCKGNPLGGLAAILDMEPLANCIVSQGSHITISLTDLFNRAWFPVPDKRFPNLQNNGFAEQEYSINQREAFQRGQNMMTEGQNGIDELVNEVVTWGEGGIWEMDVLKQTSTTYFFNVFRCPYYGKYRELGLDEFGVEFSCCRDEPFARGFNPQLKLVRTQTIMEGADYCDFRYYLLSKGLSNGLDR